MSDISPWLVLIGLGAFHGLNPAMGWLFAVALGLYRQSRTTVLVSLIPIAIGHALADRRRRLCGDRTRHGDRCGPRSASSPACC
jgi:hypothetical protein